MAVRVVLVLLAWSASVPGSAPDPAPLEITAPTVTIRDFTFGPPDIRIKAGDTVRWLNDDPVPHTVTADDGSFDSGTLASGEGYSRRFDTPGEYAYHCTPHPFMVAKVIVEAG